MSLHPENVIKQIFLAQMYSVIIAGTNTNNITCTLWRVLRKYGMEPYVVNYLSGGQLVTKNIWKQSAKEAVHSHEETLYQDGLQTKMANRFLRAHNSLVPHGIYDIIRKHMSIRSLLINIIKLAAFPEDTEHCTCDECGTIYTDTVEHYVPIRCEALVQTRCDVFDNILDQLDCAAEAKLFNASDDVILDTLLSRKCQIFRKSQEHSMFLCRVARNINKLMYVV